MPKKNKKEIIVVTSCVADLLHIGHIRMFERCRALGDRLYVGIAADLLCAKYKRLPIIPEEQRMEMVKSLSCVDDVMLMTETNSAICVCEKFNADIFARGNDLRDKEADEYMKSVGGKSVYLPTTSSISTTSIIAEIEYRYRLKLPHLKNKNESSI